MSDKLYTPSNPNAQQGVRNVLKYLSEDVYKRQAVSVIEKIRRL